MSEALAYWRGPAGDAYAERNPVTSEAIEARRKLWCEITNHMLPDHPRSVLEVGANVGLHLRGLKAHLHVGVKYVAVEPNIAASLVLVTDGVVDKRNCLRDIEDMVERVDLVYTAGCLIHINPDDLLDFCRDIHDAANRWIVAIEYFSKKPEEIEYRGEMGRLWKRDWGSFYLDNFPDLHPIACGFAWHVTCPTIDDCTWWLLEKR
jgi:pseudaminic acid biosynthesis-associated methylase